MTPRKRNLTVPQDPVRRTKHRYSFGCGHGANATVEQSIGNMVRVTIVADEGTISRQEVRACPRCARRIYEYVERVIQNPRNQIHPLPPYKGNGGGEE